MRTITTVLLSLLLFGIPTYTKSQDKPAENVRDIMVVLTGQCRMQPISELSIIPCDNEVIFSVLRTGRSHLVVTRTNETYVLAGGSDRQPDLENYFLIIDTLITDVPNRGRTEDRNMEGECHFRVSKSGVKFYSIRCDVYDRVKGRGFKLYLDNITNAFHKPF